MASPGGALQIGDWQVDPSSGTITRAGESVRLEPKVMAVLLDLASHQGTVRPKEAIIDAVWSDSFVGEAALSRCISELRRTLGDDARNPRYIETLPKRGYRLLAEVTTLKASDSGSKTAAARASVRKRALGTMALALALMAFWWAWRWQPARSSGPVRSIAVLPLRALSDEPSQHFFAAGLTEQILTQLAGIKGLSVSRADSQGVDDHNGSQIAQELGVDAVLGGSVGRSGQTMLINLELQRARTGFVIWAGSFQERAEELLQVQQEVAAQATREIALALAANGSAAPPRTPLNPEALQAYERGRILSARGNPADALRGMEYYHEAMALEPDSALVHAALADAHATLAWNNWTPPESAYGESRVEAYRALDLDPRLPEGHAMLAALAAEANWDWPEAERGFRTAIDLDPGSAFARERFSRYLRRLGRLEEALGQTSEALTIEPHSLTLQASHGWNLLLAGRLDEATQLYERILELDDDLSAAYVGLCAAHNLRRQARAAIGACERAAALPGHELQRGALGYAHALAGDTPRARRLLAELQAANGPGEMAALAIATIELGLGDRQSALDGLERALEQRVIYVAAVLADPYLRQLRDEPRFQALLETLLIPIATVQG